MSFTRAIGVGRLLVILVLLLTGFPIGAQTARADSPEGERLAQEPGLRCFAAEASVSNEAMARYKLLSDHVFGWEHSLTTMEQWRATWWDRWQFLADVLGIPNPMLQDEVSGAHPAAWCARLIETQELIERGILPRPYPY